MAHIIILGPRGSDAGYWQIVNGKLIHVPGWSPEALAEVATAAKLISQATALRTPELANRVAGVLTEFVNAEVSKHVKDTGANTISVIGV